MSLDTVLKIGNALRHSDNNLKHFKYIKACPQDTDGKWPICITIPVKADFNFDWENISLTPENERKRLYYLKYKKSDADTSSVKYIFGDIFYSKTRAKGNTSKMNEEGYKLGNPNHTQTDKQSSFNLGNADYKDIIKDCKTTTCLISFRESLKNNLRFLETILNYPTEIENHIENQSNKLFTDILSENLYDKVISKNYEQNKDKLNWGKELSELTIAEKEQLFNLSTYSVFIHFKFPGNKHWYQYSNDLDLITQKILSEFVDKSANGLVLKKTLYKTLCSGNLKNDIQFPMFSISNRHKAKRFTSDELEDLFYAIDYTTKGKQILGTNIKLIVLPCGNNLTANDYDMFHDRRDENRIIEANNNDNASDMLFNFSLDDNKSITTFDLIFCKKGGSPSSPDFDLVEISGIRKSKLLLIMERINNISKDIESERKEVIKTDKTLYPLRIDIASRSILGTPQYNLSTNKISFKANSQYQSHLLKILPLIYTESYYQDDILLPTFIQNIEYCIRAGDLKYNMLKYDLKFLLSIQNNNLKSNKYMEITNSENYQIGYLLGKLAKKLTLEIKSFEKSYVGTLTRRISTLSDFITLKNDIEQKLIMHDKTKFTYQISYELAQKVKQFKEKYDKEKCTFGFLEAYFEPIPKKGTIEDNSDNQQ